MRTLIFITLLLLLGCSEGPKAPPSEITLSWTGPTEYTDGSPISLSEIGGYKIYYGSKSGEYYSTIDTQDTEYVFKDLPKPTYFVVTCYLINGVESAYSNEVVH